MTDLSLSRRDSICTVLRNNRLVISGELLFVTIVQIFEVWDFPSLFVLFPFGWLSLWLRKSGWRDVGLSGPASWPRTIGIGVIAGVTNTLIALWLIEPLLHQLGIAPEDLSQFEGIQGNIPILIVWIIIGWILGAFAEEMVYRGYLLNRFADFFGHNQTGWIIGLIGSSAFFAFAHLNLGMASVISVFFEACFWAVLYLGGRRNLWLPIIGHGVTNTIALVMMYQGQYP